VGIDVAEATCMIVLGADRFGLATLHQLRGRVGRGREPGICVLVPGPSASRGQDLFDPAQTRRRLEEFLKAKNGFEVGALDLSLRGPGELLGESQHGPLDLAFFDFGRDADLIAPLGAAAGRMLESDPDLDRQPQLAKELDERFGRFADTSEIS